MALGSTQSLVKMSNRNIPGGKGGWCVRLTSPPSVPNVMKTGSLNLLETYGPHRACYRTALPFDVFLYENRAVYEMWKNTVQPDRPQMAIWRMRIACWVTDATETHSDICDSYCISTATMVSRTCFNITLYI
jgi:hypothetical protein